MDEVARRRCRGSSPARLTLALLCLLAGLVAGRRPSPAGAAGQGRVRLVRQTSWVSPGDTLTLALRTADIADPTALELAVTVHPAVRTRVELVRTMLGEGLTSAIGPRSSAAVPLPEVATAADGTLTVQVPTEGPASPGRPSPGAMPSAGPSAVRLRGPGIYPVHVELRELGGGETVDRFTTHLLAVDPRSDGARLGTAVVLPLSAPPSTGLEGVPPGPPAGASAIADAAAGLTAAPQIPVTIAPTPEVLESLAASDPTTAAALREALSRRDVLGRPYVPLDVPALGSAAAPLLPRQLETGRAVARTVLNRDPIGGVWLADEPLDGPALAQVVGAGAARLVVPQGALGPSGPEVPSPLRPVTVPTAAGSSATALVADATMAARLDGRGGTFDQPLVAHHVLADLAAIATLPADQGKVPPDGALGRQVTTVLGARSFTPTRGFLTELLGGLAASPVLQAVDLAAAFSLPALPPDPPATPRATTTGRARRGTTTTVVARTGRTLAPLPADAAGRGIGDVAGDALWQLSTHGQVLREEAPIEDAEPGRGPNGAPLDGRPGPEVLERRLLVATSADLPLEQRRSRLRALADRARADLAGVQVPERRTLRLTARTGQLPVGISNDTGRTARVLLQLDSEKLDFPAGNSVQVVLDRRTNTQPVAVRVRASGSFPVKVRVLTPDGSRVLQETEYIVQANTVPGVAIAVGGAAALFLAVWWAKTLLPERRHARRRRSRRSRG